MTLYWSAMAKPYTVGFVRRYRQAQFKEISELFSATADERAVKLQAKLERLEAEMERTRDRLKERCTHPLEYLEYTEHGREDDYGSYMPGTDTYAQCALCGAVPWEDHD